MLNLCFRLTIAHALRWVVKLVLNSCFRLRRVLNLWFHSRQKSGTVSLSIPKEIIPGAQLVVPAVLNL